MEVPTDPAGAANAATRRRRGIPIYSVRMDDPDWDAHLQNRVYLREIERQGRLASLAFGDAIARAMLATTDADDDHAWASLQGGLFAAILVYRLLSPGRVQRPFEGLSLKESQAFADDRGRRLRGLLDIDEDEPLLRRLAQVRNSLEHFDDRLDAVMSGRPVSIVDWYISDGSALMTSDAPDADGPMGYGLRTLFAQGGLVYVGRTALDLFALDAGLFELRARARTADNETHLPRGRRARFGGQQAVQLLEADAVRDRLAQWLQMRATEGMPVPVRLQVPPEPGDGTWHL